MTTTNDDNAYFKFNSFQMRPKGSTVETFVCVEYPLS